MTLRGHRIPIFEDLSNFCNDTTANAGAIVCVSTASSGTAMDDSAQVVTVAADPSGKAPAGLLIQKVVNENLSRQHPNYYANEVQTGGKVTVVRIGEYVTDQVYPGATPTAGAPAYVSHSGYLTPTNGGAAATPRVGTFATTKDEDGFVRVQINIV